MTRLPMAPADRRRFYKMLTGTNESLNAGRSLQLSPQSAYTYLTQYGVHVVSDQEATDLYLTTILQGLRNKKHLHPVDYQRLRG